MGVPGNPAPAELAATELFAVDAYRTEFDAAVVEVDREGGRVRLSRTAFYPVGGGQPWDLGTLQTSAGTLAVTEVRRQRGPIWHTVEGELPGVGDEVHGQIDWDRRHRLMRTHTALHILCGVIWADYGIPVTGGNMEPMKGRLDFPFPAMSADLGAAVEKRINDEIARAHEIVVDFLPRACRRRRPRADPHQRQPDPAGDRPAAGDRHRRPRPAGRRRHPRPLHRGGGGGPRRGYGEQGQGQQADPPRSRRPGRGQHA